MQRPERIVRGDWQTPDDLADRTLDRVLAHLRLEPASVLEPTCGTGAFLAAAARRLPASRRCGYEIDPSHVASARSRLPTTRVERADFFAVDWDQVVAQLPRPPLVLGNPPWVTNAVLGALGSDAAPPKGNFKRLCGLDAMTGKSNFDVSEWMILRLLQAMSGTEGALAMLCKSAVARRIIELVARERWSVRPGGLWRIDAGAHFDAAVDAVLFVCRTGPEEADGAASWPVFGSLDAEVPETRFGVRDGVAVAELDAYAQTRHLAGRCDPQWRSGLKHDCAAVMELRLHESRWVNAAGEVVDVEPAHLYPLLKSSDLAHGRCASRRAVIVPQRSLGEDTSRLATRAPRLWRYLERNADALGRRRSSIYRGQPAYAIFGIGEYAFSPWKVAISGLYKRLSFVLVPPWCERPVMLDDTCYFLPFADERAARAALFVLQSDLAQRFFRSRIFWDAKRPINKGILQALDIERAASELAARAGRGSSGLSCRS
jgi:hypothetical protein